MYGAKKVVAFAKAFIKARKESAEEGQEMSAITTMNDINDDDEDNDQEGGEAEQVMSGQDRTVRKKLKLCLRLTILGLSSFHNSKRGVVYRA